MRFSTSIFFMIPTHPGPWIRFCQDIRSQSSKNLTPRWAWKDISWLSLYKQPETHKDFRFDSAKGSKPRSFLRNFDHTGAWLSGEMHTAELDLAVRCTSWCLTPHCASHRGVGLFRKCPFLMFSYLLHLSTTFYRKKFWSKKDSLNNLWLMLLFSC